MTDKIQIDRSVVEQAMEDMEMTINYVQSPTRREDMRDSIEALRAALEQEKSPQNASSALQASCEVPQVTDQTEHFLVLADEEVYCTKHPQVEQQPVAWIENLGGGISYNPYHDAARKLPDGVRFDLYVHQQNLRCKSNQARLATLWGYEKKQPPRQPLTDQQIHDCFQHRHRDKATERRMITRSIEFAHGITGEQA